jgi:isoleucyl-tRNA synthetase
LARLGDDLKFVFITSNVFLEKASNITAEGIDVMPSAHTKCERCWHYRADVGSNTEHLTLCGRCVNNLFGSGEQHQYA